MKILQKKHKTKQTKQNKKNRKPKTSCIYWNKLRLLETKPLFQEKGECEESNCYYQNVKIVTRDVRKRNRCRKS